MPEPISTTASAIKAGTMLATTGLIAELVIFQDPIYKYLALVGAIVSMFGVLHEVYGEHSKDYKGGEIAVEILKGLALGFLAIPFWYLIITEGVIQDMLDKEIGQVSSSLSLIISFGFSWHTIPVFNAIVNVIQSITRIIKRRWGV